MGQHHLLKIERRFMNARRAGEKTFEVRRNDRDFQVGDTVQYTTLGGRQYKGVYVITYTSDYGQRDGWIVFSEQLLSD